MPSQTPTERSQLSRAAALTRWAHSDPVAGTAAARSKFLERFEDEVDPDRQLDPAERERRANRARRAYFTKLSLKSAQVRRARAAGSDAA